MWTLLGIAVVVVGFAARVNPLIVIAVAAAVTGDAGGLDPVAILSAFGKAFNDNRYISVVFLVLPVIGLLERYGLQERARLLIARLRRATAGRLLLAYLFIRQMTIAFGIPIGGPAAMVRPLIAPMAEAAAEKQAPGLSAALRERIRAMAAATDNVGAFFGEDIFIAMSSILLIKGFLETNHIIVQPLALSVWAIPTAVLAFIVHGVRLLLIDRTLRAAKEPPRQDGAP
ncbi:MAG TPA: DUF969 domain-containing protein [Rhizomicrobium sp.]|jgi:uncharacterized membrane protein|nr:DUF969 domain-containing protein [Rhizomicrobium sp.]